MNNSIYLCTAIQNKTDNYSSKIYYMKQSVSTEFTKFYNQQYDHFVSSLIARYKTLSHEVARDIVQSVLADTWTALTTCEENEINDILSIPYIYKVCKYQASHYLAKQVRYEMVPLYYTDDSENDVINTALEMEAWDNSVREISAAKLKDSRIKAVKHHLQALPENHRQLILRREIKREPYEELAVSLGFKNGDVCKQIVCRQLSRIRKKILEEKFTFVA